MIRKAKLILLCLVVVSIVSLLPTQASYASPSPCPRNGSFLSFPDWNRGLQCEGSGDSLHVVMNDIPTFVWTVALNALDILLRIAGILAVVLLIVNGYQYLMSAGAPEKISKAKTGLLQAIVGLAIALLASTIIYYIVGGIT